MSTFVGTTTIAQISTITFAPQLNDQQFQGWFIHDDSSLEAIDCPSGSSLFTTASYAVCCAFGASTCSTLWTRCDGNVAVGVTSTPCGGTSSCLTMSIFDQFPPTGAQAQTQIICANGWQAFSVFRTILATTSTNVTSMVTTILPLPSASITTQMSTTSTAATTTSLMNLSIPSPDTLTAGLANTVTGPGTALYSPTAPSTSLSSAADQSSKAWVAGAVIGPLAIIAIILGLLICYRRKKRYWIGKHLLAPPAFTTSEKAVLPYQSVIGKAMYDVQPQEVGTDATTARAHEMPGRMSTKGPYELSQ